MSVEITNPWTGQVDYRYDYMDAAAVEQGLARSAAAFPAWSALRLDQRGIILKRVAMVLRTEKEKYGVLLSRRLEQARRGRGIWRSRISQT